MQSNNIDCLKYLVNYEHKYTEQIIKFIKDFDSKYVNLKNCKNINMMRNIYISSINVDKENLFEYCRDGKLDIMIAMKDGLNQINECFDIDELINIASDRGFLDIVIYLYKY